MTVAELRNAISRLRDETPIIIKAGKSYLIPTSGQARVIKISGNEYYALVIET